MADRQPWEPSTVGPQVSTNTETGDVTVRKKSTGELVEIPKEDYLVYKDAYSPVRAEEARPGIQEAATEASMREQVSGIDAVGLGLERAATAGLSDIPEMNALDSAAYLKAVEEEYPWRLAGSEIVGTIGLSAMGLGIPGLATKAGLGAGKLFSGSGRAAAALRGATSAAVEGAFYGPGAAARDAALNDKPLTADLMWGHTAGLVGVSALLGGPLGALTSKGAGKAVKQAKDALKPRPAGEAEALMGLPKSWRDDVKVGYADRAAAVVSGGDPAVYAAGKQLPEMRALTAAGAADDFFDNAGTKFANELTPTAQALESAQLHTGKLKFENAIPHLDSVKAPKAILDAEGRLQDIENIIAGRLQDKAYRDEIVVKVANETGLSPQQADTLVDLQQKMDAHVASLRMAEENTNLLKARIQAGESELQRLAKAAKQKVAPKVKGRSAIDRAESFANQRGLIDGDYIRGPDPSKMEQLRGAYKGATREEANLIATGKMPAKDTGKVLPPMEVHVDKHAATGELELFVRDGRNRMFSARDSGATHVQARLTGYTKAGKKVSRVVELPIEGAVKTNAKAAERANVLEARLGVMKEKLANVPRVNKETEAAIKRLEQQITEMAPEAKTVLPKAMSGQGELRQFLGRIQAAKREVAAAAFDGDITQAAKAFAELDQLKRAAGQKAKPGRVLNQWDAVPDTFRKVNDILRGHLENANVWGRELADMQRKVNDPFHRQLNVLNDIMKFFTNSGQDSAYTTWMQSKMADPGALKGLLKRMGTAEGHVDMLKMRQYLETSIETSQALRAHYPNMSPVEIQRLKSAEEMAKKAMGTLDDAANKGDFIAQWNRVSKVVPESVRMMRIGGTMVGGILGGPVGAAGGWVVGQKMMNALNPSERITMLAQAEAQRELHNTWQFGLIRKLLGDESKQAGRGAAKATARKARAPGVARRAYVKMRTPLAPTLMYKWASESEGKKPKDKQESVERYVAKLKDLAAPESKGDIEDRLGYTMGSFGDENPEIRDLMVAKTQAAVNAILKTVPPDETPPDALFPSMFKKPYSRADMKRIEEATEAAFDPLTTLEKIADGTVSFEQMQILEQVNPEMLARFRMDLFEAAQTLEVPPNRARRRQLSIVLGVPTEPGTDPEYLALMQDIHAQKEQAYQEAASKPNDRTYAPTGVNSSATIGTTLTRLEKGEPPQ